MCVLSLGMSTPRCSVYEVTYVHIALRASPHQCSSPRHFPALDRCFVSLLQTQCPEPFNSHTAVFDLPLSLKCPPVRGTQILYRLLMILHSAQARLVGTVTQQAWFCLTWCSHQLQVDQAVVLAALSHIENLSPTNSLIHSTRDQNDQNQYLTKPIPPRPSIAHIFINNECFMSRSKEWTRVLDPVRQDRI